MRFSKSPKIKSTSKVNQSHNERSRIVPTSIRIGMPFLIALALVIAVSSTIFVAVWAKSGAQPQTPPAAQMGRIEKMGKLPRDPNEKIAPEPEPDQDGQDVITAVTPSTTHYVFAVGTSGLFTDMTGSTQLVAAAQDDTASPVTNIGFDFYLMGTRFTQFSASSNGYIRLGATAVSTTQYTLGTAAVSIITPMGSDLFTNATTGRVHYKLTGAAPNRILTVEFTNETVIYDGAGATADCTSQVRLHENTGQVEFVYGGMNRNSSTGFMGGMDPQFMGFSTGATAGTIASVDTGDVENTAAATANQFTLGAPMPSLNSPTNGSRKTYTFTPPVPTAATALTFTNITPLAMTLNWVDAPDEVSYVIQQSTDGTTFTNVGTAAGDATTFNATGLSPSTTYFWRVISISEGALSAPLSGTQASGAPGVVTSTAVGGPWSSTATWAGGVIPAATDDVTIADGATVTIDTAAVALDVTVGTGGSPATLIWDATAARTLTMGGNVTIATNGTFSGPATGAVVTHVLSLGGNLTNNGVLDFSTNADTAGASITFTGATNNTFGGSGATTDVRAITIVKVANTNILTVSPTNFTVKGVNTDSAGFLTVTSGTFKLSGAFTGTNRVFATAGYTIPAAGGFWLNNANYTVAGQNGSPTVAGVFRVTTGVFNIGIATGNSMGFSTGSNITVEGGAINSAGRFGVAAAGNTIVYTQSAGTITVCTIGNTSGTLGSFDLGTSLTSTISMTGGTIVTQIKATTIDYRDQAGSGITGVTAGTLQMGNAASGAAQAFNLRGVVPNLVITNTSANHSATWNGSPVNYNNISLNITISSGTTLNCANAVFLFFGTVLTNNGTLVHNGASSNFVWFQNLAPVSYTGSGVVTAPMTNFAVQADQGLTIDPASPAIPVAAVRLFSGSIFNSNKLTVGTGGATGSIVQIGNTTTPTAAGVFDSTPTFNPGTGSIVFSYLRTTASRNIGPEIPATRTITSVTFDDNDTTHAFTLTGGDLNVNGTAAGTLALTNGRVATGANTLYLSSSAATVTRTTGYVDGNFKKNFSAAASKVYEVGTANGYSPVTANVTAGTGDLTVAAVQGKLPAVPGTNALQRFWNLTGPGLTADLSLQYLAGDVVGNEANYQVERYDGAFTSPAGSTVDTVNHIGTAPGVANLTASYTLLDPTALVAMADLGITKTDGVTSVSAGGSTTYTITASNLGPNGATGATVTDSMPAGIASDTWTCGGAGGATCTPTGSGNINDAVNLPSGGSVTYTIAAIISGAATGSISNTATVAVPGGVTDPTPGNNSATDTDTVTSTVGPVTVTSTAGTTTPTDYPNLTAAFNAINAGTHQGVITVAIVTNTDEGTTPATLNSSGSGSASYTAVNIHPTNDGVAIVGNEAQGFGVIQLNGVDNVTLDGDNPNTAGTNRNLTVTNTAPAITTFGSVVRFATSATAPFDSNNGNTVKNLNLNGNVTGGNLSTITTAASSSNSSFGIVVGPNGGAAVTALASVTTAVAAGVTVNGLVVDNNVINQAGRGVSFLGAAAASSTGVTITNNTVGGTGTLTGPPPYTTPTTSVYTKGIIVQGTTAISISGNTVRNILSYVATPMAGIELTSGIGVGTISISGNSVTGVVANVASGNAVRGINVAQAGGPYSIAGNTVTNVQSFCSSATITNQPNGIFAATTATSATIENNKVTTVWDRNAGTFGVAGVFLNGGSGITIRNNFIADVNQDWTGGAAFSTTFGAFGLRIASGTGHKVYHNSVNMFGTTASASSLLDAAVAITATTLTGIDMRNNVLANSITGGTTSIAHVSLFLPSGGTSAMNLTLNNNAYFSGPDTARNGIAQAGVTAGTNFFIAANFVASQTTPATNLRAYTSTLSAAGTNDNASFASTVPAPFTSATDLHIPNGTATQLESGGAPVGVTTDIDGDTRNATTPDIGADEFNGVAPPANDIAATAILVPANGGVVVTGGTVTPQASFTNAGLAAQTNVQVKFTITGPGGYNYTDTETIASISAGQQLTVSFAVTPVFTTVGSYVSTAQVITPDANPANDVVTGGFQVKAALSGTYTVGTGGDFTSLTNPGGVFDNINSLGTTSNLVINITSDLSGESGSVALNEVAGGFTVTIKPSGGARTITSTATAASVIKLNDADHVTIDGSTSGGTDRSLTIINANPAANTAVIWLGSNVDGAQNNVIKNLVLAGGADQSVTNTFNFAIISSSSASILTGGTDNDNNTYTNNLIRKVSVGIISIGGLATNMNQNTAITNNLIGPAAFGVDEVSTLGVLLFNENAPVVTGNELRFIGDGATTGGSSGRDHVGISLCTGSASWSGSAAPTVVGTVTNGSISANRIHDIVERATFSSVGIVENCTNGGAPTGNIIANNMIYNILANGTSGDQTVGIGLTNGNGDTVAFNSVYLTGDIDPGAATSASTSSYGISAAFTTNTNLLLKDNISVMDLSSNTTTLLNAAIEIATGFTWGTGGSNFNNWYAPAANAQSRVGAVGATFQTTLAAWQTATSQDANSLSVDPLFVSGTDLHLQAGSPMLNAGSPVTGITTDFDGQTRDATPDIGADEVPPVVVNADLAITKTDGVTTVTAGGTTTYTITASNAGPSSATGATVADTLPAAITGDSWTCVGAGGGTCAPAGSGSINDTVNLPAGGSVTYTVTANISAAATGNLSNTATVTAPAGVTDPTPVNNSATDVDSIGASADLAITKTDGVTTVTAGGTTTYTITASNAGPSNATGATVADTLPAAITGDSWTCVGAGGGTCTPAGSGAINDVVNLPSGGSVTYTVSATISGGATGTLSNTASVTAPAGVTDPTPGNNSATDTDTITGGATLSISDARVTEGNSGTKNMAFTVTFTPAGPRPGEAVLPPSASAHYHTSDGTATGADNDYVPEQNGIITFGGPRPSETSSTMTINIVVNGDTKKEPNEFFFVTLDTPSGAIITRATAAGVIVDDDRAYVGDMDHDRKTDLTVFRPSDSNWYTQLTSNGNAIYLNFGLSTDHPVPGDYDGDGVQDYAVRRPGTTNQWYYQSSSDFGLHGVNWGIDSDLSVQADYDGDGKTDIAVFRSGVWYILQSSNQQLLAVSWGQAGDIPVPGDFDGDGKADFTVFRAGVWYTLRSSNGSTVTQQWGVAGDKPVAGDFDGDGRFDYTVFRNGTWYILNSLNGNLNTVGWGVAGDIPIPGDYDGDGTTDVAVFRPSQGNWYVLRSSDNTVVATHWGANGDIPIPAAYQP